MPGSPHAPALFVTIGKPPDLWPPPFLAWSQIHAELVGWQSPAAAGSSSTQPDTAVGADLVAGSLTGAMALAHQCKLGYNCFTDLV